MSGAPHQARPRRALALRLLLAAGCVWFGLLALVRPGRTAQMLRSGPWLVRVLGVRDLASAATLLAGRAPGPAIAARILLDLGDAVTFARRRPPAAAVALAYAALGVAALRAGRR